MEKNVFGERLELCCTSPKTGYFRDGSCRTASHDTGTHTVCAIMNDEFLQFSASRGTDLITPIPYYQVMVGASCCLVECIFPEIPKNIIKVTIII